MSSLSLTGLGAGLPGGAPPLVDPALEPAAVRTGDQKAKNAYRTGLAFEQVLAGQMTQAMTATVPGLDGGSSGSDGLGGTTDDTGLGGLGAYSSLLPQTLASGLVGAGGTGVAMEIARAIDPALGERARS